MSRTTQPFVCMRSTHHPAIVVVIVILRVSKLSLAVNSFKSKMASLYITERKRWICMPFYTTQMLSIPGFTAKDLLAVFISANTGFDFERNNFLSLDFLLDRSHRNHLSAAFYSIEERFLLTQLLTHEIKMCQKVRKTPHFY